MSSSKAGGFSLFAVTLSVAMLLFGAPFAYAFDCEISKVKTEEGLETLVIAKGTGQNSRLPTLEELFDAMNDSITLHDDLHYDEAKGEQPLLYARAPSKKLVPIFFRTVPKKGKADPACKNKKITGYECRVQQMREDSDLEGMPEGLKTAVVIQVPKSQMAIFDRITMDLHCERVMYKDGTPVSSAAAAKVPVKLKPAGGSGTKP